MGPRATCFCRLLIFSRIILTLVEVCESSNITSCIYERPEVNPALTLPATVTYTYTGVMPSQTACSLACCSKESSCAGFVYEKGSKTCLMAIKSIYGLMPGDLENNYPTDIYIDVEKAVYQDLNPVKNDRDCSGGWKYSFDSDTYYCYHTDMTKTYDQARSFCDTLYPGAYLVAIETHTEKVFLESNTVVAPYIGSTDCYHTSGRLDLSGKYRWFSTGDCLTYEFYCYPDFYDECIHLNHGCWMYFDRGSCSKQCAALCELPPA